MANRTQDEVRREFFASRGGYDKPPRFRWSGNTVIRDGSLWYVPSRSRNRRHQDPVHLACFTGPKREILMINGEAFFNQGATAEQNALRRAVEIREDGTRNPRAWHTPPEAEQYTGMTVPYAALISAGVELESVRSIEISPDRWEEVMHPMPDPPKMEEVMAGEVEGWVRTDPSSSLTPEREGVLTRCSYEGRINGRRFQIRYNRRTKYDEQKRTHVPEGPWRLDTYSLRAQPQNGVMEWQQLEAPDSGRVGTGWQWRERIHRLGATVFSGVVDGRRHRYISAFDQQEPTPMYYLAQLPDRGKCEGYNDAIELLAPPIVKTAREEGRLVYRQGDIFAIQVNLTTEEVYARALYRVRREVVLQDQNRNPELIIPPAEGEVTEKVPCRVCQCNGHRVGYGQKATRALMVHGTSHTADEVAVCRGGVTFVRGTLRHDPHLEEPGRRPEHQDMRLWDQDDPEERRKELADRSWFLCVRNTVPRQRRRPIVTPTPEQIPDTQGDVIVEAEVAA